ncbi:MAG: prolipoprotein diacylglyceryl transferase [Oscillospiraceae bacterium]|jgi:phosphatidylglycerol:prolipoprotein diacylglycerol transferase|nr:prolipoprotein diacylglyceryl transferase [Oscillospiraceae bacterium]
MQVSFPKLGFDLDINNVAFTIFGKEIYWYGVLIAMGFLLALVYAFFNHKRFKVELDPLIDVVIVGLICAVLGARIYYVIFYFNGVFPPGENFTFLGAIVKFFAIWEGGLAIYGGVIAAFGSAWFMCKKRKLNAFAVFDLAAIGFLIGQGIGRWGNFTNQEAFGSATNSVFGMVSANTDGVAVHPCFLYESLWCLAGLLMLHLISHYYYRFKGQIFLLYLFWYGLGRFWIEALRSDSLWLIPNVIKISQLIAAVCVIAAAVILVKQLLPIIKEEKGIRLNKGGPDDA